MKAGKLPTNPAAGISRLTTDPARHEALSSEQAESIRAKLPTQRDRVFWGLLYAAGLRTEEALALRWSDVRVLGPAGGRIAIDRVFVAGEFRLRTKTGKGRESRSSGPWPKTCSSCGPPTSSSRR